MRSISPVRPICLSKTSCYTWSSNLHLFAPSASSQSLDSSERFSLVDVRNSCVAEPVFGNCLHAGATGIPTASQAGAIDLADSSCTRSIVSVQVPGTHSEAIREQRWLHCRECASDYSPYVLLNLRMRRGRPPNIGRMKEFYAIAMHTCIV